LKALGVTVVLLALWPAAARGALILNVEQKEVAPSAADQMVYLDVWLDDPVGIDEKVNGFTLAVRGRGFTPDGVRFVPPKNGVFPLPSSAHPYVLRVGPYWPNDFGSPYDRAQIGADVGGRNDMTDVSPQYNGLVALPVLVPAGTPPGVYSFEVDLSDTFIAAAGPILTYTLGQEGRLTVLPEPSAAGAVAAAAVLMLKRRSRGGRRH
jgi:hypothetical protein